MRRLSSQTVGPGLARTHRLHCAGYLTLKFATSWEPPWTVTFTW